MFLFYFIAVPVVLVHRRGPCPCPSRCLVRAHIRTDTLFKVMLIRGDGPGVVRRTAPKIVRRLGCQLCTYCTDVIRSSYLLGLNLSLSLN